MLELYLLLGFATLMGIDFYLYSKAKFPERRRYRRWPLFRGFAAYIKFGPDIS